MGESWAICTEHLYLVGLMGNTGSFDQQPHKTKSIGRGRVVMGEKESESSNGGLLQKQKSSAEF